MAGIVNPLNALGGFQNQQLQRFTAPAKQAAAPSSAAPLGPSVSMPTTEGFGDISDRASRQHSLFLTALRARQAPQQQAVRSSGGSGGGGGYSGGGGAGGPLSGRYNLVAGADQALQAMNAAFRQKFGYDIKINEGGRTRARQQELYNLYRAGKGNLAAKPGTSLHESGRALDLGGAFQNAGSAEHRWLQANAGRWGYKWTGKNFKQFEPWHWEWHG